MKHYALIALSCLVLLALATDMDAVNSLSAASKVSLARHAHRAGRRAPMANECFQAFISVDDNITVEQLKRQGVKVNAVMDGFVVATIPVDALSTISSLPGVCHISLARHMQLCNDSARYYANIDGLHTSSSWVVPLTGKGVIVGMVDTGIDFNHINLCDAEGRSRVRAVYMPMDSTGTAPVVHGDTLPGSCYETAEQIARLTTDYAGSSHGTHTTGTAAGSFVGNGWHGVAPEADIVACGIPSTELTDATIANALIYIFDYADRAGKPCVINLSVSSNGGPNDGSSFLCRTFEALSGPGRVCVVSAGNDGNAPVSMHATIHGEGDTLTTLLRNAWGGLQRQGFVSAWSDGAQQHRSRLVIINRASRELEYASPFLGYLPEDSVYSISSDADPDFARFYDGEVLFGSALEPSYDGEGHLADASRYHSFWQLDATSVQSGHLLGMQYVADEPVLLSGWTDKNCYFYTFGIDGVTGGEYACSISDMATTDSVISVGAYCSRTTYFDKAGTIIPLSNSHLGDIAYFSSYGPDERGYARPDICAPGMTLLSSASRYDSVANREHWPSSVILDGVEYPYYSNQGTSMSAPIVAGTVALMLQLNGELGPMAVREALHRSACIDSYVTNGDPARWGFGKLDAAAAIEDVVRTSMKPGDVNNDREVTIADVMAIIDIIIGGTSRYDAATLIRADVNRDSEILLADINNVIDLILNH